ncbi:HlyIII-domain-containing protein [Martensiomyces pterosporus]|nr:HlyIII-domain-containing protein [Martensiomyces pterosporus]
MRAQLRNRLAEAKNSTTAKTDATTRAKIADPDDEEYTLPAVRYRPLFAPGHPKYTTTIDDVPGFLRDKYILSGYRRLCYSYSACIHSLTYVHNESGNILTHFLALAIFAGLAISTNYNLLPAAMSPGRASWGDYVVFYGYIFSACVCFTLSTLFHLFSCHSHKHHVAWLKCDFVGILVLILGSFIPGLYYGYFESRGLMVLYMGLVFSLFIVGVAVSVSPHLQKPNLRWLRPVVFISISLSGAIPVAHHIIAHGLAASARSMGFYYMLGMGGLYVAGTLLYAFNIPERWLPGLFDIVGNSHQLFHCLVFFAALTHYYGIVQAFKWHHSAQSVV